MKKKAFTLIEIVVVLVIIGILAVMSYPGIFRQIERQKAQWAMRMMNDIRTAIETCGNENEYQLLSKCNTFSKINFTNPSDNNFIFSIDPPPTNPAGANVFGTFTITAAKVNGTVNDKITLTKAGSIITCTGLPNGIYSGIC